MSPLWFWIGLDARAARLRRRPLPVSPPLAPSPVRLVPEPPLAPDVPPLVPDVAPLPMLPLLAPVDPAAPEHDEQLYHTRGWYRDLWLESLGIEADPPAQGEAAD